MSFNLESSNFESNTSELNSLIDHILSKTEEISCSGLKGSSKQFYSSLISKKLYRQILYVVNETNRLDLVSNNFSFFLNQKTSSLRSKNLSKKSLLAPLNSYETFERISFLKSIQEKQVSCVEAPTLFEKLIPKISLNNSHINLKVGADLDRDLFINSAKKIGYLLSEIVESPGQFAVRGSVIDIYSPGYSKPLRLEFLGDTIHSLRFFEINSQTSIRKIDEASISPASELIYNSETLKSFRSKAKEVASEKELTATQKNNFLDTIENELRFQEIEWFIPYTYSKLNSLFDYIKSNCIIFIEEGLDLEKCYDNLLNRYQEEIHTGKFSKFIPAFDDLYLSVEKTSELLSKYQRVYVDELKLNCKTKVALKTEVVSLNSTKSKAPIQSLIKEIKSLKKKNYDINLISYSNNEKEKINKIIQEYGITGISFNTGNLDHGFISDDLKIAFFSENDIVEKKRQKSRDTSSNISSAFINSFSELKPGDYIVHKQFGIGVFNGLKKLKLKNREGDFIECSYKDGDKIFVPVQNLKIVQRYIGDGKKPKLDKLGSESWVKTVKKVKKAVETIAKDLLELYARRKTEKGHQFSKRDQLFSEFELKFPFEETKDQAKAIDEVLTDMESNKPMDRLICGDVGFGKTEVALRAAFKCAMDGKQVAFLVPTTLLANQHFRTSLDRLKDYPINIEVLSRFRTAKQSKEILNKLEIGQIDILIATHKLLGKDIKFNNLGLLIIDEEHKFGVKHKEKLRSLKSGIDVLSLSATPIPRTLQLSLANIRDISLINSPPEGRKPVDILVQKESDELIRKIILSEITRDGSVFFINNRIETIFKVSEELKELVPEASFAVTHGRMRENILEKTINEFINGDIDVLVTTAIVESGLDIPRANTIIIKNSQRFGMADLYQLKGRVGRAKVKGFAYLLIPSLNSLNHDARKRLTKISELQELGSGFKLALSDLEIRGAGNLFGEAQSGHIANIGLEFYIELLNNAISTLRKGDQVDSFDTEIKMDESAFIPEEYISDSSERLFYYKRISSVTTRKDLKALIDEIKDRFGKFPTELSNLIKAVELKIWLKRIKIKKMEIKKNMAILSIAEDSPIYNRYRPAGILKIYYENKDKYKMIRNSVDEILTQIKH